jgi:hypothetical protein
MNGYTDHVTNRGRLTALLFSAVLLPAIVGYGVLYREAFSVPYQDDYPVILAFATHYVQLPTLKEKVLDVATTQTNDYKLVFPHFIVAIEMELTGHLNFKFLITFGNLLLLPIAYLLWQTYQTDAGNLNQRLFEFIPISLLFFSLTYWESLDWAMAGLQNISVIFFGFLAIYALISKATVSRPLFLFLACLSAMLAAFSSANGFLLAPVGLLILLRRRALAASLAWCASFALPVAAYLYHYTPYHISVNKLHTASYISKVFYFFAFLGCAIPYRWPAALLGIMIAAIILFAAWSCFDQTNPVASYFTVWILGTALLAAWLRGAIASRYSIYSLLLLVFCYSFLGRYLSGRSVALNHKRFYATSLVLAIAFCLLSDLRAYKHLLMRREMVLSGMDHYRESPEFNSPNIDPEMAVYDPTEAAFERVTLNKAIQQHIYTLAPTR